MNDEVRYTRISQTHHFYRVAQQTEQVRHRGRVYVRSVGEAVVGKPVILTVMGYSIRCECGSRVMLMPDWGVSQYPAGVMLAWLRGLFGEDVP